MSDEDGRTLERVRFWIIAITVLALVVPTVVSYRRVYRNPPGAVSWVIPAGEIASVAASRDHHRTASVYIGLAARAAVGGKVVSVAAPGELRDLADRESDSFMGQERKALVGTYIRYSAGAPLVASEHDVILTHRELRELRERATFVEYPRGVYAIVGEPGDGGVTLYTDARQHDIYAVPDALRPER